MTEKLYICPDCNSQMFQKFNSTIWVCFECQKRNKSIKSGQMNVSTKKEPKKGLKCKKAKWKEKDLGSLISHVQEKFCNPYIRERDKIRFGKCISCNSGITQAGHFFPRSTHKGLCLSVQNIHGQEVSCNKWKSGNLTEYRQKLIERHGIEYFEELEQMGAICKRNNNPFDRFNVITIGETYKYLLENKIWIWKQNEFDEIKMTLL